MVESDGFLTKPCTGTRDVDVALLRVRREHHREERRGRQAQTGAAQSLRLTQLHSVQRLTMSKNIAARHGAVFLI